jgi:hypothetical protein
MQTINTRTAAIIDFYGKGRDIAFAPSTAIYWHSWPETPNVGIAAVDKNVTHVAALRRFHHHLIDMML